MNYGKNYENNYGNEEINEDSEIENENFKAHELHASKKNMPVKTHMRKMEELIAELKRDLNDNKKSGQILRSENKALENKAVDKFNEMTKLIMDDLHNFEKDLRRIEQNDRTETDFFKQQVNSLKQDKVKLEQNTISLETRMKTCEQEVGVDFN